MNESARLNCDDSSDLVFYVAHFSQCIFHWRLSFREKKEIRNAAVASKKVKHSCRSETIFGPFFQKARYPKWTANVEVARRGICFRIFVREQKPDLQKVVRTPPVLAADVTDTYLMSLWIRTKSDSNSTRIISHTDSHKYMLCDVLPCILNRLARYQQI